MKTVVVLFTRDLRVRDQPALAAAVRDAERVVPTFVLDDELIAGSQAVPNRLAFLVESLRDLDHLLRERGARLVVRRGDVVKEVVRVAKEGNAEAIYMSRDVSGYAARRHERLARSCERERILLRSFPGVTAVPAGEVVPAGGDHYRVFTPYWRAWRTLPGRRPERAPRRVRMPPRMRTGRLPSLAELTQGRCSPELPPGGETAGLRRLAKWLRDGLAEYDEGHDTLATEGTSRLGAYLHFGCLSAGAVVARTEGSPANGAGETMEEGLGDEGRTASEAFVRQLCWRDFHHQVLAARPDLPRVDYRSRGDRWRTDAQAIDAWRAGLTGYPIVDAGMRQLAREGYMHNRARLITAAFLTKLLYVDWRVGAAHFSGLLVDGDVANNNGNWQWVAGTGNDTRPNRVMNPIRQAQRLDPDGEYVRRYVPELAGIAGRPVHEPWRLSASERRGLDYPAPILDHVAAAEEFRRRRSGAQPAYGSSSPA
ncbi:MAG TPA: deoxyribodipyrimidine photo-lyase [Solirubrobacteraceae bacterium]|jgi:deoxyribodipyrimidine photo-lyase